MREMVNAIFDVLRSGLPVAAPARRFPPRQHGLRLVPAAGATRAWRRINHHLVMLDRERGRA